MRTWSLERAVVGFFAGAAVAIQGLLDAGRQVREGFQDPFAALQDSEAHPIPGCPAPRECREHGCAETCSEALEADGRFGDSEWDIAEPLDMHPDAVYAREYVRQAREREKSSVAASAGVTDSGEEVDASPKRPSSPRLQTSAPAADEPPLGDRLLPVGGEGAAADSHIPSSAAAAHLTHQKSEFCWCGEWVSAEGTEAAVLRACEDFRRLHAHRREVS